MFKPLMLFEEDQVQFYKDLQKQAKKYGLRTGASFQVKEGNRWAKYDMGWDPGHIDVGYQKCKNRLQKMKSKNISKHPVWFSLGQLSVYVPSTLVFLQLLQQLFRFVVCLYQKFLCVLVFWPSHVGELEEYR